MTAPVAGSAGGWSDAAGLALPRGSPAQGRVQAVHAGAQTRGLPLPGGGGRAPGHAPAGAGLRGEGGGQGGPGGGPLQGGPGEDRHGAGRVHHAGLLSILYSQHSQTWLACLLQVRLHPLAVDALNFVEHLRPEPPDEAWEQEEARIYPALRLLEDRASNHPSVLTIILGPTKEMPSSTFTFKTLC